MHDVVQLCSPCPPVAPLVFAVANDKEDDEDKNDSQGGDPRAKNCPVELDGCIPCLGDGLLGSEENQPPMLIAVAG